MSMKFSILFHSKSTDFIQLLIHLIFSLISIYNWNTNWLISPEWGKNKQTEAPNSMYYSSTYLWLCLCLVNIMLYVSTRCTLSRCFGLIFTCCTQTNGSFTRKTFLNWKNDSNNWTSLEDTHSIDRTAWDLEEFANFLWFFFKFPWDFFNFPRLFFNFFDFPFH